LCERILERIKAVVERGTFILWPEVRAFEDFAADLGVRHAIGVANGVDAITIRPDEGVVVPTFTFWASAEAIITAGARPVFCDVDAATRNGTTGTGRAVLTLPTNAIAAVDLIGCPAPLPSFASSASPSSIEDAA
jgi:dTDP-3-amino-3,4,6-trideoxy-alpha-D-glucose transaminase